MPLPPTDTPPEEHAGLRRAPRQQSVATPGVKAASGAPLKAMSGSAGPGFVAPAGPSRGFERYDGYERYDALHADLQQREWPTIHNLFRRAVAGEAVAQAVGQSLGRAAAARAERSEGQRERLD